jgi:hypothetical protein
VGVAGVAEPRAAIADPSRGAVRGAAPAREYLRRSRVAVGPRRLPLRYGGAAARRPRPRRQRERLAQDGLQLRRSRAMGGGRRARRSGALRAARDRGATAASRGDLHDRLASLGFDGPREPSRRRARRRRATRRGLPHARAAAAVDRRVPALARDGARATGPARHRQDAARASDPRGDVAPQGRQREHHVYGGSAHARARRDLRRLHHRQPRRVRRRRCRLPLDAALRRQRQSASFPMRGRRRRPRPGRKIIFTTNLPNIGDIDEALVRPGRCFAVLRTRNLDRAEARHLLAKLLDGEAAQAVAALPQDTRAVSLASVFRAVSALAAASPGTTARSPAADPSSAHAKRTRSSA